MGAWTAAALWSARQVRRRWRSLVVLGLLAGLTAGLAMAAAAGARRTGTALERLEATTHASQAIVFTGQVQVLRPNWSVLERRPEVSALATWDLLFGYVGGQPGGVLFASGDGRWGSVIDKPIVLTGKMYDPHSDDQMVIDEQTAAQVGAKVGAVVPFHAYAPEQASTEGQPRGPTFPYV